MGGKGGSIGKKDMKQNKELSMSTLVLALLAALLFCFESEQIWKEYVAIGVAIIVEIAVIWNIGKYLKNQEDGQE